MTSPESAYTGTVAVLAVKRLTDAKTRLAATLPSRWAGADRAELVLAMMGDTISAVDSAGVDRIVVVSPDPAVRTAAAAAGAVPVAEAVAPVARTAAALNDAYRVGTDEARRRWPSVAAVVLVQADLPAATGAQIREILDAAAGLPEAMVTDHSGRGTALLYRRIDIVTPPRFGPDSAAAHTAAGVVDLDPQGLRWTGIRTDVDTADDLAAAVRLGVGARTRAALALPESA